MSYNLAAARDALEQVVADWNQGGAQWDAFAVARTYTDDGLLFGGRAGHAVGRAAIEAYFASYNGLIHAGNMTTHGIELRLLAPDCVLAQGMVDFAFTLAGDAHTNSTLRASLVLRKEPDRWRIAAHHFSPTPVSPPLGGN